MTIDDGKRIIEQQMNTVVTNISYIGKGASGSAFCAETDTAPYKIVVKAGNHPEIISREKEMLDFLASKVHYKVPKTYFYTENENTAYLGMEYVDGTSGAKIKPFFLKNKKLLANQIVDGLLDMQSITNDKFGPFDNADYNSWQEYYKVFLENILRFATDKYEKGELKGLVIRALNSAKLNLDTIFDDINPTACIAHGDYWLPNMMVDTKSCKITAILDPYNVSWVEPEYELFAITVGNGKRLKLYETYKNKKSVSQYCDLKIELYALVNELDWYKNLGSCTKSYVYYRARRLLKQINRQNLKVAEG